MCSTSSRLPWKQGAQRTSERGAWRQHMALGDDRVQRHRHLLCALIHVREARSVRGLMQDSEVMYMRGTRYRCEDWRHGRCQDECLTWLEEGLEGTRRAGRRHRHKRWSAQAEPGATDAEALPHARCPRGGRSGGR